MNLETVTCNNCGTALQVPAERFVTCTHCQTSLEVHRDASVVYTEKVSEIADNTHRMADELAELRQNSELERVDREWEQERQKFLIRGQNGESQEPSVAGSMIGGILLAAFSVVWMGIASRAAPAPFAMFGVLFLIAGIAMSVISAGKARDLAAARQRYQRRRTNLLIPNMQPAASRSTPRQPAAGWTRRVFEPPPTGKIRDIADRLNQFHSANPGNGPIRRLRWPLPAVRISSSGFAAACSQVLLKCHRSSENAFYRFQSGDQT